MNPIYVSIAFILCGVLAVTQSKPTSDYGPFSRGQDGLFGGGEEFGRNPISIGSSYSQPQQQQTGRPYGAGTQSQNVEQGLESGRFVRSPEAGQFGGSGGFGGQPGFSGSSYSQPQQKQAGRPYGAGTRSQNVEQGLESGRFVRSPEAGQFGGSGGFGRLPGFSGSSYSQPQQQQAGRPYGAGTRSQNVEQGLESGRFVRSPEAGQFGGSGGFGGQPGFSGSSYSQPQQQQAGRPYGAGTQSQNHRG